MPSLQKLTALVALLSAVGTFAAPAPSLVARAPPAQFTALPNVGPGGSTFTDSPHFRIYGQTGTTAQNALNMLEAAYKCFVNDLGWRSSGLSYTDTSDADGPWYKVNIYSVATLPGAAGVMHSDYGTGMAWLEVQNSYAANPGVVVHEYGHGLTYHAKNWVDQGRTGAWWETTANWIADTYKTSSLCAAARAQYGQPVGNTEINLQKTIGNSFQVLVDGTAGSGNYYEAWPFFTYLHTNLDNFPALGPAILRNMWSQYSLRSNETPLHTLSRLSSTGAQRIVGRYWARMAYLDIGHSQAQQRFLSTRGSLNFANLDSTGSGNYRVKNARQPRYMGANINPLKFSGSVTITARVATISGSTFTATLVARNTSSGATRYVELSGGSGSISVASGEEATLVVVNTPALILYDPFSIPAEVNKGLDYTVALTNATF